MILASVSTQVPLYPCWDIMFRMGKKKKKTQLTESSTSKNSDLCLLLYLESVVAPLQSILGHLLFHIFISELEEETLINFAHLRT